MDKFIQEYYSKFRFLKIGETGIFLVILFLMMLQKFIVRGRKKLHGSIKVSGSKNAALPILCSALLTDQISEISNVPDIEDIRKLLKIFQELNVATTFKNNTVIIDPSGIKNVKLKDDLICSMRGSILLLSPLLSRFKEVDLPFPGGCVLGKRPAFAHTAVFKALGAEILDDQQKIHLALRSGFAPNTEILMPEQSVTATENALIAAAVAPGITTIKLAATEPHVQDLCHFLQTMGAKIDGIGTSYLTVEGKQNLQGSHYQVTGDYLDAGTLAIAALVTQGEVTLKGIFTQHLDSFWQKLDEAGAKYECSPQAVRILPSPHLRPVYLRTAVYPGFATDLQAPFAVLLTQAEGESRIFETLFDGRLNYLVELEKMGAKVEVLNPHQAIIRGSTPLEGVPIASCDIRSGAAMILAALCAEGTTEITNINYIDRGYEKLDEKFRSLGGDIERVET